MEIESARQKSKNDVKFIVIFMLKYCNNLYSGYMAVSWSVFWGKNRLKFR